MLRHFWLVPIHGLSCYPFIPWTAFEAKPPFESYFESLSFCGNWMTKKTTPPTKLPPIESHLTGPSLFVASKWKRDNPSQTKKLTRAPLYVWEEHSPKMAINVRSYSYKVPMVLCWSHVDPMLIQTVTTFVSKNIIAHRYMCWGCRSSTSNAHFWQPKLPTTHKGNEQLKPGLASGPLLVG